MKSLLISALTFTGVVALAMVEPPQVPPGHPTTQPTLPAGHPGARPQLPAGHQPIDQALPPVEAAPEDVATVDAILDAYYASISGPKGTPRDWDRLRSLFVDDSRFISLKPLGENAAMPYGMTVEQYIQRNKNYFERGGYFESDIHREIDRYGGIAQVFSTYEARRVETDPPYSRGINSFQLVYDGQRWWITTLAWQIERHGQQAIPERYLPESQP